MRIYHLFLFLIMLGCQSKPTVVKQEVANQDNLNTVLVDTRSSFEFTGFHIAGSVNLNYGDFLILKNPKTEKRILDPDLGQTIERLAKRGVSPLKTVVLIGETKDSIENKKWRWLFQQLDIRDVTLMGLAEYRALKKSLVPQAVPEAVPVWEIKNLKNILLKADQCFVNWSDSTCN